MARGAHNGIAVATVLLLTLLSRPVRGSYILDEHGNQTLASFESPRFQFSPDAEGQLGVLVGFNTSWCEDDCTNLPENFTMPSEPAIMLLNSFSSTCFFCGYAKLALMAQELGAIGLLRISDRVPGHESRVIQNHESWDEAREAGALAMEFSREKKELLKVGSYVELWSTTNPWVEMYNSGWIAVQVLTGGANLFVSCWGIMRLLSLKTATRFHNAILCIALEVVASLLRTFYCATDPTWSRGILTYSQGRFFMTISIPVSWLGSTVLFLAWEDLTQATLKLRTHGKATLSSRGRIIFVTFAICFFVVDVTLTVVAAYRGVVLAEVAPIMMGIVNLIVAIMFMVAGWRFTSMLRSIKRTNQSRSADPTQSEIDAMRWQTRFMEFWTSNDPSLKMTRKLVNTSILMLISTVTIILSGSEVSYTPLGRAFILFVTFISLAGQSMLKISAFRSGKTPSSSTANDDTNRDPTTKAYVSRSNNEDYGLSMESYSSKKAVVAVA